MPIRLEYDAEKRILYGTIEGSFGPSEIEETLRRIVNAGDHPPDVDAIWDMRGVAFPTIESELARQLFHFRSLFPQRGRARIAGVVADDLGFGMARMHQIISSGMEQQIRIFRDLAAAEAWLLEER